MNKKKRPVLINIVGWYFLSLGIITFINFRSFLLTGRIQGFSAVITLIVGLIFVCAGIGVLKGLNWGRHLYVISAPFFLVYDFIVNGFSDLCVLRIIVYVLILLVLIKSKSARYFSDETYQKEIFTPGTNRLKTICSAVILGIGGLSINIVLKIFYQLFFRNEILCWL